MTSDFVSCVYWCVCVCVCLIVSVMQGTNNIKKKFGVSLSVY